MTPLSGLNVNTLERVQRERRSKNSGVQTDSTFKIIPREECEIKRKTQYFSAFVASQVCREMLLDWLGGEGGGGGGGRK